jgi:Tfp pilus assembly protein PilP
VIPRAIAAGVILLGLGHAWAQLPTDAAAAIAVTAEQEKAMAGETRSVTRSAIGAVFGAGQGAAPGADEAAAALAQRGRDPFRPVTLDLRPETHESEVLTPLQRYELPQLRLAGVVLELSPPRAMLQDNSGMGYIVTPGTPIGRRRGVVKAIESRRIVVEEHVIDYYGREQTHHVVIEMAKDEKPQSTIQE